MQVWSGANEVKKGRSYVRRLDHLSAEPLRDGWQLGGTAYGTDIYQVQATIEIGKVSKANCSCPVGSGGYCKHTAALLTRYSERPGDFKQLSSLSGLLEALSAPQLRGLIERLLQAAPELRVLTERLASGNGPASAQTASIASLFFQLERQQPQNSWEFDEGLDTSDLGGVMDDADVMWDEQPAEALAIYLELLAQMEQAMESWAAPYGDPFDELFRSAVDGVLSLVGEHKLAEAQRTQAVAAIFGFNDLLIVVESEEFADFAAELPPGEHAELLRRLQQARERSPHSFQRERFAQALLKLIPASQQTPAQREELLLSEANDAKVAEYFLTNPDLTNPLTNPDTAQPRRSLLTYFTKTHPHTPLEPLFSLFQHHAAEDALERILEGRLGQGRLLRNITPELHWLFERYASTGRREQAFELAWKGFAATASPAWEQMVRAVSLDWTRDWQRALREFDKQPGLSGAVLKLLLEGDHELAEAEAYDRKHAQQLEQSGYGVSYGLHTGMGFSTASLREELSRRLGEVPEYHARAAEIRFECAEALIARRGRDNYQEAAVQLGFLPQLIGQAAAQRRITELAQANKALRSLQEELKKAGLT